MLLIEKLYQQVINCQLEFPSPEWDSISAEAVNFIKSMLKVDPKERITVEQALEHPWITGNAPKIVIENWGQHLKQFNVKRKLKKVANGMKAAIRMKKLALL